MPKVTYIIECYMFQIQKKIEMHVLVVNALYYQWSNDPIFTRVLDNVIEKKNIV